MYQSEETHFHSPQLPLLLSDVKVKCLLHTYKVLPHLLSIQNFLLYVESAFSQAHALRLTHVY